MIYVKTPDEIELMRKAGAVVRDALLLLEEHIKPGISTKKLDKIVHEFIIGRGAYPSFLGYEGYPASICASIDEVVVHGIPSERTLEEGEIIGIDIGACLNGFHGDAARTFAVGKISPEKRRLMDVCKESFFKGVGEVRDGVRLYDISNRVQTCVEAAGYSVVRALVGHGIGRSMHEDPSVPNYGEAGRGVRLRTGMTIAVEPMINMGRYEVEIDEKDGWTVRTRDRSPSAHYENTIAVTDEGIEILTL